MSDKTAAIVVVGSVAGALTALVGDIPYLGTCLSCLVALGAGAGAVWHYTENRSGSVAGTTGASLGAGASAFAAVVSSLLGVVLSAVGLRPSMQERFRQGIERMRQQGMSEQQIEMAREMFGSSTFLATTLGCTLVLYAIFGAIGGAAGASFFGEEEGGDGGVQTAEAEVIE